MILLALDTATPRTAVALVAADGEAPLEAAHDPAEGERPGHAHELLPLAHGLLARAGLELADVERIAVGLGPGTFTGLRIGVATARALAQGTGAELAGVPTLRALAAGAEHAGPVLAVLDARRGEAFVAGYADGAEVLAPRTARPEELPGLAAGRPWLAVGDGAVRFRSALERGGAAVAPDDDPVHRMRGAAVARLGARAPAGTAREDVVPLYLRPPDAQPRRPA